MAAALVLAVGLLAPAGASALWGAIAVNPNTAQYGYSYDFQTQHQAKRKAKNKCQGHCKTAVTVYGKCAATVYNSHGYYSAVGRSPRRAYKNASHRAPGKARRLVHVCTS